MILEGTLEDLKPYLEDKYIADGLYMPVSFDDIKKRKNHIVHILDGGFALFVNSENNIWLVSCGFYRNSKDVFKQCKASLDNFLSLFKDIHLLSLVHRDNKKARMINNALNFKYVSAIDHKKYQGLRLYNHSGD